MQKIKDYVKKSALISSLIIALSACGGSDKYDKSVDELEQNRSSKLVFVNTLDEMVTFYVKNSIKWNEIFDDNHEIIDLVKNSSSEPNKYTWHNDLNNSYFGVQDTNSKVNKAHVEAELKNGIDFFVVSWESSNEYKISVLEKKPSNTSDVFRIRVFTDSDMNIKINGSDKVAATAKKGEVSSAFTINNCSDSLQVGNNHIDLCQGDIGQSYLVVVDSNGKQLITQE
jgi:hypothetical protein